MAEVECLIDGVNTDNDMDSRPLLYNEDEIRIVKQRKCSLITSLVKPAVYLTPKKYRKHMSMDTYGGYCLGLGIASICLTGLFALWISQLCIGCTTRPLSKVTFHGLHLNVGSEIHLTLNSSFKEDTVVLKAVIGKTVPNSVKYVTEYLDNDTISLTFDNHVKLKIKHEKLDTGKCYELKWENIGARDCTLEDGILFGDAHWYGGAPVFNQLWPVETWNRAPSAFVTGDSYRGAYGGVQERYWISSSGAALYVDWNVPLFVGVNNSGDGALTLQAKCSSPYKRLDDEKAYLKYTLCESSDIRTVHDLAKNKFILNPMDIPDERMFRYPIWSTWAKYKKDINQQLVIDFAAEIQKAGFKNSQLEIDDDWTPRYGDLVFDETKFPDPAKMVLDLKNMGYRVTLWVHPFASVFSSAIREGSNFSKMYWIRMWIGNFPAIVPWWDGLGSILDLTNEEAIDWFYSKLKHLETTYGIDSFKFDAGESSWLPNWRKTQRPLHNPNEYTRIFAEMAYNSDTEIRCQEVRAAAGTQHLPMFVRLMDKDSKWGYENGLKSIIPHVLTMGIIGYPFILPDMIGGNAYFGIFIGSTSYPDRELFIRWLQLNTFLPSMQFSVTPWQYDDEVVQMAHKVCRLHEQYADLIISLAKESVKYGHPIIRPLWWVAPNDETALTLDTEYLLGDDLLVAPVVEQGAVSRDVYLPNGQWKDMVHGGVLEGGQWYKDVSAPLDEILFFTRVTKTQDLNTPGVATS